MPEDDSWMLHLTGINLYVHEKHCMLQNGSIEVLEVSCVPSFYRPVFFHDHFYRLTFHQVDFPGCF